MNFPARFIALAFALACAVCLLTGCAADGSFDPNAFSQVVGAATTTIQNYEHAQQPQPATATQPLYRPAAPAVDR